MRGQADRGRVAGLVGGVAQVARHDQPGEEHEREEPARGLAGGELVDGRHLHRRRGGDGLDGLLDREQRHLGDLGHGSCRCGRLGGRGRGPRGRQQAARRARRAGAGRAPGDQRATLALLGLVGLGRPGAGHETALGGGFGIGRRVCCWGGDRGHVRLLAVVLLLRQDAEGGGGSVRAGEHRLGDGFGVRAPARARVRARARGRDPARARRGSGSGSGSGLGLGLGLGDDGRGLGVGTRQDGLGRRLAGYRRGLGDREGGGDRQGDHVLVAGRPGVGGVGTTRRRRRRGLEDRGRDVRHRGVVQGDGRCLHGGRLGRPRLLGGTGDPGTQSGEAAALVLLRLLLLGLRLLAHRAQEDRLEADRRGSVQLRDVAVAPRLGAPVGPLWAEPGWPRRAPKVEGGATGPSPSRRSTVVASRSSASAAEAESLVRGSSGGTGTRRDRDTARRGAALSSAGLSWWASQRPSRSSALDARLHRVVAHGPKVRRTTPVCSGNRLVQRGLGVRGLALLAVEVAQEVRVVVGSEGARVRPGRGAPALRPPGDAAAFDDPDQAVGQRREHQRDEQDLQHATNVRPPW